MEIQVLCESRNENVDSLRGMAVRRAKFATRRLVWLVPRAELTLSNVTGTYGGVEKRCDARLQTVGIGIIVSGATAPDWRNAVDNALTGAVRRLMRRWRRAWEPRADRRPLWPVERYRIGR